MKILKVRSKEEAECQGGKDKGLSSFLYLLDNHTLVGISIYRSLPSVTVCLQCGGLEHLL